jgi:integrase
MKAIHGGKAKNDKIDSQKIAALLRGGLLPQAYVYPAAMRSTRDLLRRRLHLVRKRGQLLAHIQNTRAQYQLPEFGRRLAYPANRTGVSEHFSDPSVRKSIDVDLALLERYDDLITDLELTIVREAKRHDGDAFHEEQALLAASAQMGGAEHKYVGSAMHDRIIGALDTCCRRGEMLRIQNRHVDWERHQIAIPGRHAKDAENRRIPFDSQGRLAPVLKRRASLGPNAYVFGSPAGEFVANFKTAWESLLLIANGHDTKRAKSCARVDRAKLRQIDLHWHDLRHEGACRLLAEHVDIRTIQRMLGHADIKPTQRYLNITDEELRKPITGVWERRRQLRAVSQ